jgi:ribosome-binding factor A
MLLVLVILLALEPSSRCNAFSVRPARINSSPFSTSATTTTQLAASQRSRSASSSRPYSSNSFDGGRSKRQERVGHLVRTELSRILHSGNIKGSGDVEVLDAELRQRISIVSADVSPDLRQARISVSIRAAVAPRRNNAAVVAALELEEEDQDDQVEDEDDQDDQVEDDDEEEEEEDDDDDDSIDDDSAATTTSTTTSFVNSSKSNPAVDKRRAYSWLVRNNKALRHSLAQRMSHIKTCPQLSFVQIDVGAAVDVMQLIDQVTAGSKKRDTIAVMAEDGEDDEFAGDDWIDDDDDFF